MVVLPDHLHLMMTLPENDDDFATRLILIKSGFSRQITYNEKISQSRKSKRERGIWQRRYWEYLIRDDNDFATHVDYIHYNPVKHGYISNARNWQFSTLHKFIDKEIVSCHWGDDSHFVNDVCFGE